MLFLDLPLIGKAALLTALLVGLTVHEFAHAWSAFRLGDLTAYSQGRLTLNPRRHIEPFGALMVLIVGFGWAKPVPIDPHRLGRWGTLVVSIAGPVSNLLLATIGAVVLRVGMLTGTMSYFFQVFVTINIMLGVFNLLPIAPLDGWRVLYELVPRSVVPRMRQFEPYGAMVLMALLVLGTVRGQSILGAILGVPIGLIRSLLLGPSLG